MVNRKLIRPNLAEIKERFQPSPQPQSGQRTSSAGTSNGSSTSRRRVSPPEATSAEAFYYLKQMNGKTQMIVILDDGERLQGHIEWYDRGCIKVHREDGPNLLVFKHNIKYLYKQEDEPIDN